MKNMLRTAVVAAVGLMVLTLALTTDGARAAAQGMMKPLLVKVMNTAAEPVAVVSSVDRVLLQLQFGLPSDICPDFARAMERVLPDATRVPSFSVPPGKKLVLTDLQALVIPQLPWSVGDVATVGAFAGSNLLSTVIRAREPVNAAAVSSGIVPVSVHLQTGGVIGPGLPVCLAEIMDVTHGQYVADLKEARLHGYLIDQ